MYVMPVTIPRLNVYGYSIADAYFSITLLKRSMWVEQLSGFRNGYRKSVLKITLLAGTGVRYGQLGRAQLW